MNDVSKKYEEFISDTIKSLYVLNDIKKDRDLIEEITSKSEKDEIIDYTLIQSLLENINYNRTKIKDISSSVRMYFSMVEYEEKDMIDVLKCTKLRAEILKSNINKNIIISEFIPDFSIDIMNLGFDGIIEGDIINIRIFNESINEYTEKNIRINRTLNKIGQIDSIIVKDMRCPKQKYEYCLEIKLIHDGSVYSNYKMDSINIR